MSCASYHGDTTWYQVMFYILPEISSNPRRDSLRGSLVAMYEAAYDERVIRFEKIETIERI